MRHGTTGLINPSPQSRLFCNARPGEEGQATSPLESQRNTPVLQVILMLMSPNKGKTAVHGCHWPRDMVVCMLKVLAITRSWYVCFSVVNWYYINPFL